MTLDEFVQEYTGQSIDWDGNWGPQCMDLIRKYIEQVLCIPQLPLVRGAADVWRNYQAEYYDRIANGPTNYPLPGSIVIWSRGYGGRPIAKSTGHIAIAIEGDPNFMVCFSQNDPVGTRCGLKKYTYNHVLGWLCPKTKTITKETI